MADLEIRALTEDDDLDAFGRIVLASYLALPDMPREPDYETELADVAARVRNGVVFGAFVDGTPAGCVTFVADASSPHAEGLLPGESSFRMLGVDTAAQGRGHRRSTHTPVPCRGSRGRLGRGLHLQRDLDAHRASPVPPTGLRVRPRA